LAVLTEAQILAGLWWPLSEAEVVERFVGRSAPFMHEQIERHLRRPVNWEQEFESWYREVFEQEWRPVDGIVEVLQAIGTAKCVTSSGTHAVCGGGERTRTASCSLERDEDILNRSRNTGGSV
jgi:phosphoglycolate phosphatase-like HAD superfamily hydrolase